MKRLLFIFLLLPILLSAQSYVLVTEAPPSLPIDTTGLVLWLKADAGVVLNSGNVSEWQDQSSRGNSALQNTATNQPLWVADGGYNMNNNPTIRFSGDDYFNITTTPLTALSVFVITKLTTNQQGAYIFGGAAATNRLGYYGPYGYVFQTNNAISWQETFYDQIAAQDYHITSFIYNGTTISYYENGVLIGVDNITGNLTFSLLAVDGGAGLFNGDLSEVLLYNTNLNTIEQQQVEAYLFSKIHNWKNEVPIMTSETAPSGVVTKSHQYSETYAAWKMFDNDDYGIWAIIGASYPEWVGYQFTTVKTIQQYRIKSGGYTDRYPTAWTIQASNNNIDWVVLDSQTGQVFGALEKKSYNFVNTTPYLYYRLVVSAGQSATELILNKLELSE